MGKRLIELINSFMNIGKRTFRQIVAFSIIAMMFTALVASMFWKLEDNRMIDAIMMAFSALVGYYFGSSDHQNDKENINGNNPK